MKVFLIFLFCFLISNYKSQKMNCIDRNFISSKFYNSSNGMKNRDNMSINPTRNKIQKNKKLLYKGLNNNEKINDSIFSIIKDLNNKIELINYNHFIDIRNICDDSQLKLFNEVSKDLHRIFSKKPPRPRK